MFAAAIILIQLVSHAASGSWNVDAAGNWSTAGNWSPAAAPSTATGDVVNRTFNLSGACMVTIDTTSRIVGTLNIGDPTATFFVYTLAASGGVSPTFNNGCLGSNLVRRTTTASDIISAPVALLTT